MTQVKANRNFRVDIIKNLAIFGVVFIHAGAWLTETVDGSGPERIPGAWGISFIRACFRWAVPFFILSWAFYFQKGSLRRTVSDRYPLKRFLHLLRVFVCWSLIYFLLTADLRQPGLVQLISAYWSGYGWSGQYYFIILFQLLILFPLFRWVSKSKELIVLTFLGTILLFLIYGYGFDRLPAIVQKISFRPFIYWGGYVVAALLLTKMKPRPVNWLMLLPMLVLPLQWLITQEMHVRLPNYVSPGVLIAAVAFSFFLVDRAATGSVTAIGSPHTTIAPSAFRRFIEFGANNTMTVFVMNPFWIILFKKIQPPRWFDTGFAFGNIALAISITGLIYLLCLGVAWILNRTVLKGWLN